jgi:hypothetical protein
MEKINKTENVVSKNAANKKLAEKKKIEKANAEFKKKYFDYYDDIKISHREDW